jgi:hypothetical protein
MENQIVSLNLSKEIINPIVERNIKEAVLAAMGGSDEVIKKVMDSIIHQKVGKDGSVSTYSSENKYSWLDVVLTKQIEAQVRAELTSVISSAADKIKAALMKKIRSEKGSNEIADALIAGLQNTFKDTWTSKFSIQINQKSIER